MYTTSCHILSKTCLLVILNVNNLWDSSAWLRSNFGGPGFLSPSQDTGASRLQCFLSLSLPLQKNQKTEKQNYWSLKNETKKTGAIAFFVLLSMNFCTVNRQVETLRVSETACCAGCTIVLWRYPWREILSKVTMTQHFPLSSPSSQCIEWCTGGMSDKKSTQGKITFKSAFLFPLLKLILSAWFLLVECTV